MFCFTLLILAVKPINCVLPMNFSHQNLSVFICFVPIYLFIFCSVLSHTPKKKQYNKIYYAGLILFLFLLVLTASLSTHGFIGDKKKHDNNKKKMVIIYLVCIGLIEASNWINKNKTWMTRMNCFIFECIHSMIKKCHNRYASN